MFNCDEMKSVNWYEYTFGAKPTQIAASWKDHDIWIISSERHADGNKAIKQFNAN